MPAKKYIVTQEVIEKVIRGYKKGMDLDLIGKLICPKKYARQILEEANIPIKQSSDNWRKNKLAISKKR